MNHRIKFALVFVAASMAIPLSLGSGIYASADSTSISAGSGQGVIVFHAHRISSADWASCFALKCNAGTGPGATMYFVVYNSTGALVTHGFADESGTRVIGLNTGQIYSIYPADCDLCHNSTHNVVFDHWGDNSTIRPRPFMANSSPLSVDAYYKIVELGAGASSESLTGNSSSSSTASPPPETQPPLASTGSPPADIALPEVGNAGHVSASLSVIQVLREENVVVITHGKEVFKAPLQLEGYNHHQGVHHNPHVKMGQAELQKYISDQIVNFQSVGEHPKAKAHGGGDDKQDNGDH